MSKNGTSREEFSKTARKDDDELIEAWRENNDKSAYKELKSRHEGMVMQKVNQYAASAVPRPALEGQAWKLFDKAVKNYDPDTNAKFSTYLHYQLLKLDRFTTKHQNTARLPESVAAKIGDFDRAQQQLAEEKGREPTHDELSDELGMSKKRVKQIDRSRRKDLFESGLEGLIDEPEDRSRNVDYILEDARSLLTEQEKKVYDRLIGYEDHDKVESKKELARELGMSPGRVSQITKNIARKIRPHLERRL